MSYIGTTKYMVNIIHLMLGLHCILTTDNILYREHQVYVNHMHYTSDVYRDYQVCGQQNSSNVRTVWYTDQGQ